jgi:hypothetical protein
MASKSASEALESATIARRSAEEAKGYAEALEALVDKAEEYKSLAYGYQGQASASATLAQNIATSFSTEINTIKQAIRELGGNV